MFVASDCELIPGMALLLCFFFTNKILKKVCWLKKKIMACINPKGHVLGSNKFLHPQFSSVQFSHSVMSDSLLPHGLQHARLPSPSLTPRACSNSCPSSQWCHPNISSSVIPSPHAFCLSQHQDIFQWVTSLNQVAKALELQVHHQSFQ